MSTRLLFRDLQNSRIPAALNVCPTDERLYQWANEAEGLMLNQGRWYGSTVEAQFCVDRNDCTLTWPRQVAAVERVAINGSPIRVNNGWYAFTRLLTGVELGEGSCEAGTGGSSGCGWSGGGCVGLEMRVREGTAASFATTLGANKVIRCYPTSVGDVGKKLVFQGRDTNGIWVRSVIDGAVADGEQVTLAMPFVDTLTVWGAGSPQAVVKDVTERRVLVYSYDTVEAVERALADYEPGETRPTYTTSTVPGLRGACQSQCTNEGDAKTTLTALVSLQHVELTSPNDWLILQNLSAYKAAMIAVKAWEEGDAAKGDFNFYGTAASARNGRGVLRVVNRGGAIPLLQAELRKNTGDRVSAFVYLEETNRQVRDMAGFR